MNSLKPLLYIAGLLAIVFTLSSTVSYHTPGNSQSAFSASSLSIEHEENGFHDFGVVPMEDGTVEHGYTLVNNGQETVGIERVYTSCMCTTAYIENEAGDSFGPYGMLGHGLPARANIEIAPGEKLVARAVFDPAAHGPAGVGRADREIFIETNSTRMPELRLSFTANVVRE